MTALRSLFGRLAYGGVLRWRRSRTAVGRWLHSACNRVRQRLIRCGDPVITMPVADRRLRMHLSHQLPLYWAAHPLYDRALPRIAGRLADALGEARVIDVGANIGDTATALLTDSRVRVLCVEGDDAYYPLLLRNTTGFGDRVICVRSCCDEAGGAVPRAAIRAGGTTRFAAEYAAPASVPSLPLDAIAAACTPPFVPHLLKIDTDGFDFKVLRGADELIRTARPAIYFEWQPEFLTLQGEDPLSIFPWLAERGYDEALLYGNLGDAVAIHRTTDAAAFTTALSRIDGRTLHYYDVLLVHRESPQRIRELPASEFMAAGPRRQDATPESPHQRA